MDRSPDAIGPGAHRMTAPNTPPRRWQRLRLGGWIMLFLLLTATTQFGAVLLLAAMPLLRRIRPNSKLLTLGARLAALALIYVAALWLISNHLAPAFGRVPLPCTEQDEGGKVLAPANIGYCLMARNFVTPRTRDSLIHAATKLAAAAPHQRLLYLDAGLAFFDHFPLLPHLSHHDGRKVDLAFAYRNSTTGENVTGTASPIGYWAYEAPRPDEQQPCRNTQSWLRWDFDALQPLFADREMDPVQTRALLLTLLAEPEVEKVLLEPHLQDRLGLRDPRLRFQGCRAARHDDHIHVQMR